MYGSESGVIFGGGVSSSYVIGKKEECVGVTQEGSCATEALMGGRK